PIRRLNETYGTKLSIPQALQGPKIRIKTADITHGALLQPAKKLPFTNADVSCTAKGASTTFLAPNQDDNSCEGMDFDTDMLEVKLVDIQETEIITEVIYGGYLKSKKGVNLPNTRVSIPSVTPKDYKDLDFGLENEVEWIALSFVRKASDIEEVRSYINSKGKSTRIVAKIEKPEAVENIDSILEVTDAIMVARGDLGVELPAEDVPMIQKMLV